MPEVWTYTCSPIIVQSSIYHKIDALLLGTTEMFARIMIYVQMVTDAPAMAISIPNQILRLAYIVGLISKPLNGYGNRTRSENRSTIVCIEYPHRL